MFTGIIEEVGKVVEIVDDKGNLSLSVKCSFTDELKVDQSVAHNGVCLTVVAIKGDTYTVTAIKETLEKSNLKELQVGDPINLERGMRLGDRLDGHIVQGHVDQTGVCENVVDQNGSWAYEFSYSGDKHNVTIPKGSITVNGVSLTVVNSGATTFSVAIIPYTYEHTNFNHIQKGSIVNLEFDVIGKYVARLQENYPN